MSELAHSLTSLCVPMGKRAMVVFTGGEPTLQLDERLLCVLLDAEIKTAVETNGTRPVSKLVDWVCVSPKAGSKLVQLSGDELKIAFPQAGMCLNELELLEFSYYYLQPITPASKEQVGAAMQYCLAHPQWRLSLQMQKVIQVR